jgi:hypothetical protein
MRDRNKSQVLSNALASIRWLHVNSPDIAIFPVVFFKDVWVQTREKLTACRTHHYLANFRNKSFVT